MQGKYARDVNNRSSNNVISKLTNRPNLLLDYAQFELKSNERVVCSNEHWMVVVPYWAVWPFETLVIPTKNHIPSVAHMNDDEKLSLAQILREISCR